MKTVVVRGPLCQNPWKAVASPVRDFMSSDTDAAVERCSMWYWDRSAAITSTSAPMVSRSSLVRLNTHVALSTSSCSGLNPAFNALSFAAETILMTLSGLWISLSMCFHASV